MVNNFSPPYLRGLITPQKFTRIHRNYVKTLEIPFYNSVRHGPNSFSFFGTWNNLQIRTLSDLLSFSKVIATGLYTTVD